MENALRFPQPDGRSELAGAAHLLLSSMDGIDRVGIGRSRLAAGFAAAVRVVERNGYWNDPMLLRDVAETLEHVVDGPFRRGYARGLRVLAAFIEDVAR
jgi:hypothetical protein